MGICMVWGIRVWVYCATGANALVVYDDDGGVHEISAQVFDDIHTIKLLNPAKGKQFHALTKCLGRNLLVGE